MNIRVDKKRAGVAAAAHCTAKREGSEVVTQKPLWGVAAGWAAARISVSLLERMGVWRCLRSRVGAVRRAGLPEIR